MLDKERIKNDADAIVIAEELGIRIHHRGSRKLILCPAHNDKTVGSCYIDHTGYRCYACNRKGDVFDLVQSYLNIDFNEAMQYIADICGGEEYYQLDSKAEKNERIGFISKAEQEVIRIKDSPIYVDIGYTYSFEEAKQYREEGYKVDCDDFFDDDDDEDRLPVYIIREVGVSSPLFELYRNDKEQYRALIEDFCYRKMDELEASYQVLKNPNLVASESVAKSLWKVRQYISNQDLVVAFNGMFSEVEKISKRHGLGECSSTVTNIVAEWAVGIWEKEKKGAF